MHAQTQEVDRSTLFALQVMMVNMCVSILPLWWVLSRVESLSPLSAYFGWIVLSALLYSVAVVYTYRAMRLEEYMRLAHTRWIPPVATVGVQIINGLLGMGAVGLLLGQVAGQTALVGILCVRLQASCLPLRSLWQMMKSLKSFPMYNLPTMLLNLLNRQLPILASGVSFPAEAAGQLALAVRLGAFPVDLVVGAFGQALMASASAQLRDAPHGLFASFKRLVLVLGLVASVMVVLGVLLIPPLFRWFFPSTWQPSGVYLLWLLPIIAARVVALSLMQALVVLGKLRAQMAWEILLFVLGVLSFVLPVLGLGDLLTATATYSLTQTVALAALVGYTFLQVRNFSSGKEAE
ncbi:MAG: oligosaccharide flippase family protein [Armatimonadota bacterium]|nr:oligosaccharide flippase family protein [Armatimonadota bacterium]